MKYTAALDLKAAYNMVPQDKLMRVLGQKSNPSMCKMIVLTFSLCNRRHEKIEPRARRHVKKE